jgi:hypothetical protein
MHDVSACRPCIRHALDNTIFLCMPLQYLRHVGCPAAVRNKDIQLQLLWLLRLAIAREYEDDSKQRLCLNRDSRQSGYAVAFKTC